MNFQMNAFKFLKMGNNLEKIASLRISLWPEHSHQAFGRSISDFAKVIKTDSGVDIIAQNCFASVYITGQKNTQYLL